MVRLFKRDGLGRFAKAAGIKVPKGAASRTAGPRIVRGGLGVRGAQVHATKVPKSVAAKPNPRPPAPVAHNPQSSAGDALAGAAIATGAILAARSVGNRKAKKRSRQRESGPTTRVHIQGDGSGKPITLTMTLVPSQSAGRKVRR